MAQSPFKADVYQVEPSASGTRTMSRESSTGGLLFTDPAHPSGINLTSLAGLQSLTGVTVVGTTYATIQEAIDGALTGGDTPLIVVPSGVYTEDVTISKDVAIVGLGYVKITNDTATDTITITEDADGVPRHVVFHNITVECTEDGSACVSIDGSNTFAVGSVTVNVAPLAVGDTITINGNVLTGVAGARTPGDDDFDASLGTVAALAGEIELAITDALNSFAGDVTASSALGVVSLEAVAAGVAGNAVTLAVATVPGGGLTVSGASLSGGGGINSEVGQTEIALIDCTLAATGIGTRQIDASIVNYVRVQGGTWFGSSSTSETFVSQVASFKMTGVEWVNDVQAAYDTGEDQPIVVTSDFSIVNCGRLGDVTTNFIGAGSLFVANVPIVGDVIVNGDRSATIVNCELGATLIEDTVVARLVNSTRDSLGGVGAASVAESSLVLSQAVVAANNAIVSFAVAQPDLNYTVIVDVPVAGITANTTVKALGDFQVDFSALVTGTVYFTILRQM